MKWRAPMCCRRWIFYRSTRPEFLASFVLMTFIFVLGYLVSVDISLPINQACAFSRWFMGNAMSTLTKYPNTKINVINTNEAGNSGLVDRYKIHLRQLIGAPHFILKNHIYRTYYN